LVLSLGLAFAFATPVSHANAQTGASITLRIGDRYRGPDLGFYDEPTAVSVPGRAGVYYVQDSDNDVYRYNNMWYMNYNGDWYRSNTYRGPWAFVGYRSVPQPVYTVPTGYRRGWSDYRDTHYDWSRSDRYSDNSDRYSNTAVGGSITLRIGDRYRGPDLGFNDEPRVYPVRGRSGVYYVRDSNNDVYRYGNNWYLNYNGDWYRSSSYRGPWVFVGYRSVPQQIYTVPSQYRRTWRDYRDRHYTWRDNDRPRYGDSRGDTRGSITLRIGDRYRGPSLGFTVAPSLVRIPGRGVYYVQDSDNDVYRYGNYWYLNYNGDWYRSDSYRGPWVFVGYRSVPSDVYSVPTQYRRSWSDYRDRHYQWRSTSRSGDRTYYSDDGNDNNVSGVSGSITLRIGDRYNGPDLGFSSEPRVVSVPGTRGVYYVRDADNDVYRYGNNWYLNYNGDWYRAGSYDGPWVFVGYRSVPRDVYSVPTSYRRTWTDYRDRHYDWNDDQE
jgi:hypothetical protein